MARKKKVTPFEWGKGPKAETFQLGSAKLTIRGLTYREALHVSPMDKLTGDIMTMRMAVTAVTGLELDGEAYAPAYEDYEHSGRTVKVMTDESFDAIFEPNYVVVLQVLAIIVRLTGVTVGEATAAKLFRS